MDDKHLEFAFEYGLSGGYSLRLVKTQSRLDFLPQLTMVYLRGTNQSLNLLNHVQYQFMHGEIFLIFNREALVGIVCFDNIGVRDGAQLHGGFWGDTTNAIRKEAGKMACDLMLDLQDPRIIRIDAFTLPSREDVVKYLDSISFQYIGMVPNASFGDDAEFVSHQYWVYIGE